MRPLRAIIDAARYGKRLTRDEKRILGEQLDAYWVDRCDRCRRKAKCDELWEGRCEECHAALNLPPPPRSSWAW